MPAGKPKPWDGTPLVMLVGGPRHGWVYKLADYDDRGFLSSFDGYSPLHRRGDAAGVAVMSTIGEELRHYQARDPALAATPVQLWSYSGPAESVVATRRPARASGGGGGRAATRAPVSRPAREPFVECPECSRPGGRASGAGESVYRCAEGHYWPAPEVARHIAQG